MSTRDKWALFVVDYGPEFWSDWKSFPGSCSYCSVPYAVLRESPEDFREFSVTRKETTYRPFLTCRDHVLEYLDWGVHGDARSRLQAMSTL